MHAMTPRGTRRPPAHSRSASPRVEAREVARFAHLAHGVEPGLAGFACREREQLHGVRFVEIGHAAHPVSAFLGACRSPRRRAQSGRLQGCLDVARRRVRHAAHDVVHSRRISDFFEPGAGDRPRDHRSCLPDRGSERLALRLDRGHRDRIGQVPPLRVAAIGHEEVGGRRDARVRDCVPEAFDHRDRIAGNLLRCHALVDDLVHERAVGAVLEQASDEVREQVVMRAHRGVDSATGAVRLTYRIVQRFTHPVQALELETRGVAGHVQHRGHRVGVVGRELRIDAIGHRQQPARAREEGDVGARLAGEHGKSVEAEHLCALHLGVPVRALHESDHDAAFELSGELVEPVDDVGRALAVGLHHDSESVPARECGVREHRLDDVEREVEPVRFLGVDVQADAGGLGEQRERTQPRRQLGHHPVALRELVARVQGGELDRHPRPVAGAGAPADAGECGDGGGVGEVVAACVGLGAGRFAQHVVRVRVALRLHRCRAARGFAHVASEHELVPELAHRLGDRGADDRLAETPDRFVQRPGQALLRIAEHLAGQQQRPGGGVDQRRAGVAEVGRPVRRPDLVLDQCIDGFRVRDSQERLGETHERHALACREPVLGEKALHDGGSGACPRGANQIDRAGDD